MSCFSTFDLSIHFLSFQLPFLFRPESGMTGSHQHSLVTPPTQYPTTEKKETLALSFRVQVTSFRLSIKLFRRLHALRSFGATVPAFADRATACQSGAAIEQY